LPDAAERWLDDACARIRDEETRAAVREELLDHLEEKVTCLMVCGRPEEAAWAEALTDMGDAEPLAGQLGLLHSRIPKEDLRAGLSKVFWGLLLNFFNLDIWELKLITTSLGALLLLAGLLQLRRCNRELKRTLWLYAGLMLLQGCALSLGMMPDMPETLSGWLTAASALLNIWCFFTLFTGLGRLCPGEESAPGILRCGFLYALSMGIALLGGSLGWLAAIPGIIIFLYILTQVRKVQEACWLRGLHAGARRLGRRGLLAVLFSALVIAGVPMLTSYLVASETPAAEVFPMPADEEAAAARQRLVDLGMAADMAADLPAEELQLLAGTERVGMSYHYMTIDGGDFAAQNAVCILDKEKREARVVSRFLWETAPDRAWRDGVSALSEYLWDEDWPQRAYSLWEQDGVTMRMPVLRQEGRSGFTPPGFEYRVLPGAEKQRLILCTNWLVGLAEEDRAIWNASYAYMHRTRFFCSPFASAAVSYNGGMFDSGLPAGFDRSWILAELPPESAQ
jgi:hypothetical protein